MVVHVGGAPRPPVRRIRRVLRDAVFVFDLGAPRIRRGGKLRAGLNLILCLNFLLARFNSI